ncbi:MAG TPA: glycosyltransferase family 39 protein [Vicinamibacteria bacterium]
MPALRWPPLRHVGVALVFAVAALLRFKGLSWGLRHPPHVDEQPFVDYARTLLARRDFDHRFYEYPGLLFYLLAAVLRFVPASAGDGAAYLAARGLVASFSLATVALAYRLGQVLAPGAGLAAAALVAVSPSEVRLCHSVRPDVVLETFVLAALVWLAQLDEDPRGDVLFGGAAGAATAVKFSGVLLFAAYLAQRVLQPSRRRLLMAAAAGAATFIAFSPYTILNARAALRGAWVQLSWHYDRPLRPAEYPEAAADYGLALVRALGIAALLLAGGGLYASRREWRRWAGLAAFPVLMVLVFSTADVRRTRFLLATTGVLAAFAARGAAALAARSAPAAAAVLTLAIGPPLIESARYLARVSQPSARDLAADWIDHNLAQGARVLVTWYANLGVDPRRFEVLRVDRLDESTWRQAIEADLVAAGPGDDRGLLHRLRLVSRVSRPHPETPWNILLLSVPEEARPRYEPVRLTAAALSASENTQALPALVDGDPATSWRTEAGQDREPWIAAEFERTTLPARVRLDLGPHPGRFGRHLQVWLRDEQGSWRRVDTEPGWRPRASESGPGAPSGQVLLLAPAPARALRIVQVSQVNAPWEVSELRIDALPPRADEGHDSGR